MPVLNVATGDRSTAPGSLIGEIVREGARHMLAAVLEEEVNHWVAELTAGTDERGRRLVVRNGHHRPRIVVTTTGPEITAPRVNDRRMDEATGAVATQWICGTADAAHSWIGYMQ